jgi:hypothetical protein
VRRDRVHGGDLSHSPRRAASVTWASACERSARASSRPSASRSSRCWPSRGHDHVYVASDLAGDRRAEVAQVLRGHCEAQQGATSPKASRRPRSRFRGTAWRASASTRNVGRAPTYAPELSGTRAVGARVKQVAANRYGQAFVGSGRQKSREIPIAGRIASLRASLARVAGPSLP